MTLRRFWRLPILLGLVFPLTAQDHDQKEAGEDLTYELEHKNSAWYQGMHDGADYFAIKSQYDHYFSNHRKRSVSAKIDCELKDSFFENGAFYLKRSPMGMAITR